MANQGSSQRGLGSENMDPQKKHEIQSEGGKASHGGGRQSEDEQFNMDINLGEEGGSNRGFAKMKEEGRDEEVREITSEGGKASHGGGRQSQDE